MRLARGMESRTTAARDGAGVGSCAESGAQMNKDTTVQHRNEDQGRGFVRFLMEVTSIAERNLRWHLPLRGRLRVSSISVR